MNRFRASRHHQAETSPRKDIVRINSKSIRTWCIMGYTMKFPLVITDKNDVLPREKPVCRDTRNTKTSPGGGQPKITDGRTQGQVRPAPNFTTIHAVQRLELETPERGALPFIEWNNNIVQNVVHTNFFEDTRPRFSRRDLERMDRRGNVENGRMDLWALPIRTPSLVHWPNNNISVGERKRPIVRRFKDRGFGA